jgi:hypothetical protein
VFGVLYRHLYSYLNIFAFFFFTNSCPSPIFYVISVLLLQGTFKGMRRAHHE